MTNPILVTGATGNVGSQVVDQLLAAGVPTRVAVRSLSKAKALQESGAEAVEMDMNNPDTIHAAFDGADKVFLVSPFVPNMVELSAPLVEAAKQADVKQIVRLAAFGAQENATTTLGQWHWEVEKIIAASGIPFTSLRPNGFMQNFVNSAADTIKNQSVFYQNLADAKVSYVDVRDIASVAVAVLMQGGHEGQFYEITGPEALSNQAAAEILSRVLGRTISYVDVPDATVQQGMLAAGMPAPIVEALIGLFDFYKTGAAASVSPVVEQVTGKRPISFEKFAQDYASAFS